MRPRPVPSSLSLPGRHVRQRCGFTLIEMGVVMAVLAILAAILLPAVMAARESARQAACLSNIRQISSGLLLYAQDFNERFPSGGYPSAEISGATVEPRHREDAKGPHWDSKFGEDQSWGWPYQVLPYINPTIDDRTPDDTDGDGLSDAERAVAASPVDIYICPTRGGQMIDELVPGWGERVAFDYAGNCGPYLYGSPDPDHPGEVIPEDGPGNSDVAHLGIFGRRPRENRVPLGSLGYPAGVVLVGDKRLNTRNGTPTNSDTAGWVGGWPVDDPPAGIPLMTDTIRSGRFPPGPDGPDVFDGFGAPHNGGGNFGFADGHATAISATIDPDVFRGMCSREKRKH